MLINSIGFNFLTLKDDIDLSPLKMCSSMRYTCMPNIKLLSSIFQVMADVKVFGQTDRRTDSSTAICNPTGGIHTKKSSKIKAAYMI